MDSKYIIDSELVLPTVQGAGNGSLLYWGILSLVVVILFVLAIKVLKLNRKLKSLERNFSLLVINVEKIRADFSNIKKEIVQAFRNNSYYQRKEIEKNFISPEEAERIADSILRKARVKVNKDKLVKMIVNNDIKQLSKVLKMSASEVEILINISRTSQKG
jgi:hypothetical protein